MTMHYPITEEQVRFYEENGYIQLLNVLTPEELEQARKALENVLQLQLDSKHDLTRENKEYQRIFVQKVNMWQVESEMKRYVFSHKIAEIARQLARACQIRLWHDHALIKMPGDSKASSWHQDLPYWPMQEDRALSCWMALDDVFVENGCMAFVPGTHGFGRLEPINLVDPQDIFKLISAEVQSSFDAKATFQPMPAGSCTFHNGMTFHYAGPNKTDKPRRAIITIYMPDEVHYTGAGHVVTDDLNLQVGDLLAGERFPVLAD
jgi:phytanoyl-CoA hydroxylase